MIPVSAGVRIWLASGHTDMRRGMRGLALQVQEGLAGALLWRRIFLSRPQRIVDQGDLA
jgi:transposase